MRPRAYGEDLAFVHDAGFSYFAERAGREALRLLARNGVRSGLVVDVGCGSGVFARRLVGAGYGVLGIDLSPAMVRLARRNAPGGRYRVASFADARLPPCDAVVAMGEVVNYLDGRSERLGDFFGRVFAALRGGGLFVFDFLAPLSSNPRSGTRHVKGDGWDIVAEISEDARRARLTRRITTFRRTGSLWRRTEELHRLRLWDRAEVSGLLSRAGFDSAIGGSYGRFLLPAGHLVAIARL
ncbi:MAG TPA: class I SAM-dependent methyltransferase [Thermoanaerobaculia bacterium]|nr:class I SAM-dependent methyltransferase [Thermoanaerobaculia bacterium]